MHVLAEAIVEVLLLAAAGAPASGPWKPLFNGKDLAGWDTVVLPAVLPGESTTAGAPAPAARINEDPKKVFTVTTVDGRPAIRISGERWGAITSKDEYENYHFRTEFKWGEKKWPPREDRLRDSGILYHATGPHGVAHGVWKKSFELQVMEGTCGDYIGVAGVKADVEAVPAKVNGGLAFGPGANKVIAARRVAAGAHVESPPGAWNVLEIVSTPGKTTHIVNGKVVMVLTNLRHDVNGREVPLDRGALQIQSEGAEVFYRNLQIRSLNPALSSK